MWWPSCALTPQQLKQTRAYVHTYTCTHTQTMINGDWLVQGILRHVPINPTAMPHTGKPQFKQILFLTADGIFVWYKYLPSKSHRKMMAVLCGTLTLTPAMSPKPSSIEYRDRQSNTFLFSCSESVNTWEQNDPTEILTKKFPTTSHD